MEQKRERHRIIKELSLKGYTPEEISEVLGLRLQSVSKVIGNAKAKTRRRLERLDKVALKARYLERLERLLKISWDSLDSVPPDDFRTRIAAIKLISDIIERSCKLYELHSIEETNIPVDIRLRFNPEGDDEK